MRSRSNTTPTFVPPAGVLGATLAIIVSFFVLGGVARAQASPEALFGEWEIRPEPGTSEYSRMTCTIRPLPDEDDPSRFRVTYDLVGVRGGLTHLEWTGNLDGRDYAVQGLDYVMTNAYTALGPKTFRIVAKVNGQVLTTAETSVSADGQTMTTVTRGRSSTGEDIVTTVEYRRLR
jgi:hypothetical protein